MATDIKQWFWFFLIGAIIGWLAGFIVKGRGFGILGDIVVGVVGALLGAWLFRAIGIATSGLSGAFISALVGAVLLVVVTRIFKLSS